MERGGGARKFRKFENDKDPNEKIFHPESVRFSCPKSDEDQKKGLYSNLAPKLDENPPKKVFTQILSGFWPKLGAGQKQRSLPTDFVLKPSAEVTKRRGRAAILHFILC